MMLVALQFEAVPALVPLKVTVLLPWLAPKLLPVMVTAVPLCPGCPRRRLSPACQPDVKSPG